MGSVHKVVITVYRVYFDSLKLHVSNIQRLKISDT